MTSSEGVDLVKAEYSSLRTEVVTRISLRQQLLSLALGFAGAFLGFGVSRDTVALVYPPLAMLLAIAWFQNDHGIRRIGGYIREHLEEGTEFNWQTYVHDYKRGRRRLTNISHGGVLLFTQLLAIAIGLLNFTDTRLEWFLLVLAGAASFVVVVIIWQARYQYQTNVEE